MQDTKKGHSMRKIMGIFGSTPCQLFSAAHVNCAFLCIHNLSINVYYMRNILSCIICTFHILALATCDNTVEDGMSWKRYECDLKCKCLATPNPLNHPDNKMLNLAD